MTAVPSQPDGLDAGCNPDVGLVLAGGGARGAYEIGALSVLLPHLEGRGERPGIVLGTSIGALNGTYLGATSHLPAHESIESGIETWRGVDYEDILGPLLSVQGGGRLLMYFGELLGLPKAKVKSLLDTTPMAPTLRGIIPFTKLARNVDAGVLASVAVVATSYATAESVVFHHSRPAVTVAPDTKRAIRYAPTRLTDVHVQASAAIPVAFPAIRVTKPASVSGWYGDGGTRLNTPIKPALKLGAKRVVVIGLNSSAVPAQQVGGQPDVFDGAAQFLQALLADQLAQDVATLTTVNEQLGARAARDGAAADGAQESVPYIFVAPRDRLTVGRLAADVYREHLSSLRAKVRARDLAALGHVLDAGSSPVRGELLSFLFFAREFVDALLDLGRRDAERWLATSHDDGPWRLGEPPPPEAAARRRGGTRRRPRPSRESAGRRQT